MWLLETLPSVAIVTAFMLLAARWFER